MTGVKNRVVRVGNVLQHSCRHLSQTMAAAAEVATLAGAPAEAGVDDDDAPLWERAFSFGALPRLLIQEAFGAGLGGTVWAGGVKLARHLVDDGGGKRLVAELRGGGAVDGSRQQPRRLHALELGAGCSGIPGLVLAQLGDFHTVVITDGDEDAVERLETNLAENAAAAGQAGALVQARLLRWGHDTDIQAAAAAVPDAGGRFDLVVAADVAYRMTAADPGAQAAADALCDTLRRLLLPTGVCVLAQMVRRMRQ